MLRQFIVAGLPVLFATTAMAASPSPIISVPPVDTPRTLRPIMADVPAAWLDVGDRAPMFSYLAADGRWHRSEDLLGDGPILLIFGADDDALTGLQQMRPAFAELGVRPVVVLDVATRTATGLAHRLGVEVAILSDPMCAIAGLYNSLDARSGRHATSYFVVDHKRTIRGLYYGDLPETKLLIGSCARALARPLPPALITTIGG